MSASDKKKLRKEQSAAAMTEKQQQAQKEAKKVKIMTISFITVMALVFVAFGCIMVSNYLSVNGVLEKNTIVANIGGYKMNTVEFSYYYNDAVETYYSNFYNEYGDNAPVIMKAYGLDLSQPLNAQTNPDTGDTWDKFFIEQALNNAKSDIVLYNKAMAEGFDKNHEDVQNLITNAMNNITWQAIYYGSVDKFVHNYYCNGATEAGYRSYVERSAIAATYYNEHMESLKYDEPAMEAFQKDRYNDFSSFTFNAYLVDHKNYLNMDEGTVDEQNNVVYTDAQYAAARAAAEKDAAALGACKTLEELNAAIAALSYNRDSETPVSASLNENILSSKLLEEYAKWLGDPERKDGDLKVFPVESTEVDANGKKIIDSYNVVMYRSTEKNLMHLANVRHLLVQFVETKDEKGNITITEQAKTDAKNEAEALYKEWQDKGGSKDDLIAMIKEHSDDSSKEEGGLFEDINPDSSYVPEFLAWSVNPERKEGDSDVISTQYGYHIMYFEGYSDETYRETLVKSAMTSEDMEKWYNGLLDDVTAQLEDTSRVKKDLVFMGA